jgi:hypothetical protein
MFPEKELRGLSPNFHIHVSVSDIFSYSHDLSAYSAAGKYVNWSWDIINRSQTYECVNWAEQFLFWEYINGIFVAVY